MNEKKFSIIIPHKNLPNLLQRCLNSIPRREDTEIIIVDDNSDPEKVDFENFPDKDRNEVKIILDKSGMGAGAARNIGIRNASGKWLLFADCDDTYTYDFNSFLNEYKDSDSEIVYYKANVLSDNSNKHVFMYMNYFIDRFIRTGKGIKDIKFGAWEPWNKMIRRDIIINNKILFDEISSSNDKMFSLKLGGVISKIELSQKICYNYILRSGSIIHSGKKKRFINSFNTILSQNALYHKVDYKRKEFVPFFLLINYKYINKNVLTNYIKYLRNNKANPFEGLFSTFFFRVLLKY